MDNIHPKKPFCGGICFQDTFQVNQSLSPRLIYEGMVFLTEFEHRDGSTYGGDIIAKCESSAYEVALTRGLGEKIIGTLRSQK